MKDPVNELKIKAAAAGTNITAACNRAGVDRSIPERWKKNVPKAFVAYAKIEQAINDIAKEKLEN